MSVNSFERSVKFERWWIDDSTGTGRSYLKGLIHRINICMTSYARFFFFFSNQVHWFNWTFLDRASPDEMASGVNEFSGRPSLALAPPIHLKIIKILLDMLDFFNQQSCQMIDHNHFNKVHLKFFWDLEKISALNSIETKNWQHFFFWFWPGPEPTRRCTNLNQSKQFEMLNKSTEWLWQAIGKHFPYKVLFSVLFHHYNFFG